MVKIPEWWIETTLWEITEVKSWSTPSTKEESFWDWSISWITPKDLSTYNKRFIDSWEKNITELWLKKSSAQLLPKNTVLFSSRAPIWYVAIANKELTTNQWFKNLICDEKISHFMFFYYWLKCKKDFIEWLASWSTFSEISWTWMKNLPVTLPPLPEQKAIAKVLSSFDDKIELLRAENQTLEEMGQTLFKEWFGKYKVWAELPDGWKVGKLGDIIELQWWYVHNPNLQWEVKCKIAKMWVVDWKTRFNRNSVIDYYEDINEKHKLYEDDIIICTRDVTYDRIIIWNVARVPKDLADFWLYAWANTRIIKTNYDKNYLFYMLRDSEFRKHIKESAKWSTIIMITKDAFLDRDIVIPDNSYIKEKMDILNPIINKIKINSEEIENFSKSRDQLLPKLMSWEVRVEF